MKDSKQHKAEIIIENLKTKIINTLWEDNRFGYNNGYLIIPWLQEEAEYAIKKLHLPEKEEQQFLIKIERIVGEYMEEI
jgi:hypothetical protein